VKDDGWWEWKWLWVGMAAAAVALALSGPEVLSMFEW
jgi:hypothetical protein